MAPSRDVLRLGVSYSTSPSIGRPTRSMDEPHLGGQGEDFTKADMGLIKLADILLPGAHQTAATPDCDDLNTLLLRIQM